MERGQNGQVKIPLEGILQEDEFRCEQCGQVFKVWEAIVDTSNETKVICAGCDFDRGVKNYLDTYFPVKETSETKEIETKGHSHILLNHHG